MIEPRYRRASATAEDLAARRSESQAPQTGEGESIGVTPRSAVRYRPLGNMYAIALSDGTEMRVTEHELSTLPEEYQDAAELLSPPIIPKQRRQPHPKVPVQDDSVIPMPAARSSYPGSAATPLRPQRRRRFPRFHWLFWVGLVLFLLVAGSILLNVVANWWQVTQDDWQYGRPRTYQVDANVGHGTAQNPDSHFIAENLDKHIIVIEIPGNDPGKSRMYVGPTLLGTGEELTTVTLSFQDVNGDGRLDLIIHVADSTYIFLNQKDGTFKPAPNQ